MERHFLGAVAGLALLWTPPAVRADNFGKFLEKTGKELLKKQISPEKIQETTAPYQRNAEVHTIRTADGWVLVAHHYRSHGGTPPGALPVILCHGLSYHALFWDLDPSCSLAEYLSRQGYDVWSVSLRGCGLSQKWVWKADSAPTLVVGGAIRRLTGGKLAPTGYATVDPKFANFDLDDHVTYDLPALVHLVRQQTGAREVAWVGHSMGGIIALCHLSRYPNPGIGKLITVGSQLTMPQGQLFLEFCSEMLKTREQQLTGKLDQHQLALGTQKSIHNIFFNERHTKPEVYEALCTWANDVPSLGQLQQYVALARTGELWTAKKDFSYTRSLGNVQVPLLICAGAADQIAPPVVQKYLHDHVGSQDKKLVLFGRAHGFAADAGHNDALVGLTSRQQVYPVLEQWLRTGR
jgi:pimeloyl-ACP methyl ester carboxylesterase